MRPRSCRADGRRRGVLRPCKRCAHRNGCCAAGPDGGPFQPAQAACPCRRAGGARCGSGMAGEQRWQPMIGASSSPAPAAMPQHAQPSQRGRSSAGAVLTKPACLWRQRRAGPGGEYPNSRLPEPRGRVRRALELFPHAGRAAPGGRCSGRRRAVHSAGRWASAALQLPRAGHPVPS